MAVIPLLPLAQAEIQSAPGRLLDRLFAGEAPVVETAATIGTDLIDIVLRGGTLRQYADRRRVDGLPGLRTMLRLFWTVTCEISPILINSIGCHVF